MSDIYLYDGSFSSLIALIEYLVETKKNVSNINAVENYVDNLLDEPVFLRLNNKDKLYKNLYNKLPNDFIWRIKYVFLSNTNNKEYVIYDFIRNYYLYNNQVIYRRNIDSVNNLIIISGRVSKEAHHMKGFLRFKKMNNFYYAEISPTNNVLPIIVNHFKQRLSDEYWIIRDTGRNEYALYNRKKVIFLKKSDIIKLNLDLHKDEFDIEDLWKTFFETIAIKERKNLKTQMNFMPKKYWKNIIEMEDRL